MTATLHAPPVKEGGRGSLRGEWMPSHGVISEDGAVVKTMMVMKSTEKSTRTTRRAKLLVGIRDQTRMERDDSGVADIDASKESWNIRVKVILLWKQTYKSNPKMVGRLDMILIDQQGNKIQATIKKNLIPAFETLFDEGAVREISNFAVATNEGDYMLVDHKHKINFYKTTTVRVSTDFFDRVDPYHLVSFHNLLTKNLDTRVAFDFLGQVVSTDPMRVIIENAKEKRLMNLVAQDLSGRKIAVALWDSFALNLNTYILEHQNDTAPVIILLRMAKLKSWGDQPQVGNCLFGSRLHINDDMPQILEFKESLAAVDVNVESSNQMTQLNPGTVVATPEEYYLCFPIKNIDDIPDYNEKVGLSIIATIIGFNFDEGWYSFYCRTCSKKVTKNDVDSAAEPFNCDDCGGVSDVYGKIRVVIRVQDETGSSSFVLFDRHIKDLIHRGKQWLMDKISKDQGRQNIPDEFNTFLNRKFAFKVQISLFNLENNYHAYTVHRLTDDESVLAEVFKRSPAYEQQSIHDDGTPINQPNKGKEVSVHGDNVEVVDLEAVTPSTIAGKRPIEIVATTDSFECSSSKAGGPAATLKIPKMEKLD